MQILYLLNHYHQLQEFPHEYLHHLRTTCIADANFCTNFFDRLTMICTIVLQVLSLGTTTKVSPHWTISTVTTASNCIMINHLYGIPDHHLHRYETNIFTTVFFATVKLLDRWMYEFYNHHFCNSSTRRWVYDCFIHRVCTEITTTFNFD